MKLLTKTNIYNSVATVVLFTVGVFVVLKLILIKLDSEQEEQFLQAKEIIIKSLKEGKSASNFLSNIGEKIIITEIYKQTSFKNNFREYEQEIIEDGEGEEEVDVRELNFQCTINDKAYSISVSKSLSEGREIVEYIFGIVVLFILIAIVFLFVLNTFISELVFSPFYDTLSKIKTWNIKKNEPLIFKKTNIDEFHLLNDSIEALTQQIQSDYKHLKEFTENVSHEAQTPLSIISTKIENLMQEDNYSQKQHEAIQHIYQATQRLYKLNQVLILMSRIENKQYVSTEKVSINKLIEEKIVELEDFIEAKQITVNTQFNVEIEKELNAVLFNILLNNLFINAIKYNLDEGGTIKVVVNNDSFSIENTSSIEKIDKRFIFERFTKSSTSASLGVGLSLIKKIIDFYNWHISYSHKEDSHKFKIYM